jgi:hypothetical protein
VIAGYCGDKEIELATMNAGEGECITARVSQIDVRSELGSRLVEYFVVVSSIERKPGDNIDKDNSNDMSFSNWVTENEFFGVQEEFADIKFRPTVTARYPLVDHHDNPLHENLTFFCHPSGGILVRKEPHMPKVRFC